MLRASLPFALALFLCAGLRAQPAPASSDGQQLASKEAKVREMFALIHMNATYAQLTDQMFATEKESIERLFPVGSMNPAQRRDYEAFLGQVKAFVGQSFSWESLEPEFIDIYAHELSDADLDGILAFYRSPAGEDLVAKTPVMLQQASAVAQQHLAKMAPEMKNMMDREIATMSRDATATPRGTPAGAHR